MPTRKTGTTAVIGNTLNGAGIVPVTALLRLWDSLTEEWNFTVHWSASYR